VAVYGVFDEAPELIGRDGVEFHGVCAVELSEPPRPCVASLSRARGKVPAFYLLAVDPPMLECVA
jgi:hypothetical protein